MLPIEEQALHFVQDMQQAYYEKKDFTLFMTMLDTNITLAGLENDRIVHGLNEVQNVLEKRTLQKQELFLIQEQDFHTIPLSDIQCVVYGIQKIRTVTEKINSEFLIHITAICCKNQQNIKLLHMQFTAMDEAMNIVFNPETFSEQNTGRWIQQSNQLKKKNRDLNALIHNIPGAAICCDYQKEFTIRQCSAGFYSLVGYTQKEVENQFHNQLIQLIHPEDREKIWNAIQIQLAQSMTKELEYRIICKDGKIVWILDKGQLVKDENGDAFFDCILLNITDRKKMEEELEDKVNRDALTGLYNRKACQMLIENTLFASAASVHTLMILDIDFFKIINDQFGHLCGDSILIDIALRLSKLFRASDVIGRIGGDEFMIFIKDVAQKEMIERKAKQILKKINEIVLNQEMDSQISCSIGIAISPKDGPSFQELYQNADNALYQAKRNGRNQFAFYDVISSEYMEAVPIRSAINEVIDSEKNIHINNKLSEYVFHVLYKSMKIETALAYMLEFVGKEFSVSRVFICENAEDNQHFSNTFEWCNDGVKSQKETLQRIDYSQLENLKENLESTSIFYCREVLSLPENLQELMSEGGNKSVLLYAIRANGVFKGFVGLSECKRNRFWTQEQLDVLSILSEIISTFLLKKRVDTTLSQTAFQMKTILDNQENWIYVIDKDTYQMLYTNKKTLTIAPNMHKGCSCHEIFFHRKSPCEECPVKQLRKSKESRCQMKKYNPDLQQFFIAEASIIPWEDKKEVCLLSCYLLDEK